MKNSRKMRWTGHVAHMGRIKKKKRRRRRSMYKISGGKVQRKETTRMT
ncbi:MAG: hypothetical protein LBT40_17685 [Deltaproteobacteria bacterium]|jgi:hypothetical protein|nr:hypothetical protein [Deltaproteobacteria bacterium]